MSANALQPESAETTVVRRNTSGRAHTVTAYEESLPEGVDFFTTGGFDSETAAVEARDARFGGGLDPGETFEYTSETAGTVPYYCIPREAKGTVGTVEIREASESAA